MSVETDAVIAAHAAYPDADVVTMVTEGKPVGLLMTGNKLHAMARTPYAQGYQAGHQRGAIERTREIIEIIHERVPRLAVQLDAMLAARHPDEAEIRGQS